MIYLLVAFAFFLYILFSIAVIFFVKKFSKKPKAWKYTALFLALLPTWDFLIALFIYIPSAIFWSGDAIYEKVKTDTIHYDIYDRKMGVIEGTKNSFFYNDISYVEMEIKKESSYLPPPGLYRYWLDKENKLQYKKISEIEAKYTVEKKEPIEFSIIPVKFKKVDIIDREKNKIIASGKSVVMSYLSLLGFPCFNWLNWYDDLGKINIYSNTDFYKIHKKVIDSD